MTELVGPDHPALYEPTPPFGGHPYALESLARQMYAITRDPKNPGIGIAAPQVGRRIRMFVMVATPPFDYDRAVVCINPELISASKTRATAWEGCLTQPGLRWKIRRPKSITAEWTDMAGSRVRYQLGGREARCFLHELDHLNGITIWRQAAA